MSATIHSKTYPALFDVPMIAIGRALADNIGWLYDIYGKAEVITHVLGDGSRRVWPDWPVGGDEYESLLPDDRTGGYAFFVLEEPVEIEPEGKWHAPMSLIVWGDMREVSPDERNTELAKSEILKALRKVRTPGSSFIVERVYERPETVFRGFDIRETDKRAMMQPFFCLRVSGTIYIDMPCDY